LSRVDSDDLPPIVSRETLQQPEFERKKVQNVSKEGFSIDRDTDAAKARKEAVKEKFDPFLKWLGEDSLKIIF
jgi:HSP90 family molecular chaperone